MIPPRTGSLGVAGLLEQNGVVRDARKFLVLAWLRDAEGRLQAGEYVFRPMMTPDQVLDQIVHGRVVIYTATLPEGVTIRDAARIVEQTGLLSARELASAAEDETLAKALGISATSLEGYLFPETYQFKRPADAASNHWKFPRRLFPMIGNLLW